ncbi:hypothetical protein S7711_09030 [Stachybotrys chartarum IBT 7711]|uniref:Uncharacterized protein n=1 Tax=Stachybotrys chartarum (strain CBS 109288 / IBT 7711) TaxID=1280523 RepID=A0A084AG08_STACB|nr:hypothetical protein S7711_09030 [Stachybotrys chartarum IBT 7711]KFA54937.1 hypothetical protein S40293_02391 [Stachybotrys chartarum IBT 40293]
MDVECTSATAARASESPARVSGSPRDGTGLLHLGPVHGSSPRMSGSSKLSSPKSLLQGHACNQRVRQLNPLLQSSKAVQPPKAPEAAQLLQKNQCVVWQVRTARYLASIGINGPFEIGDFLCHIVPKSGRVVKVAERFRHLQNGYFWQDMATRKLVRRRQLTISRSGAPIYNEAGCLLNFQDTSCDSQAQSDLPSPDREAVVHREAERIVGLRGPDPMWF